MHSISPDVQECIETCQDCQAICLTTANHCLGLGGSLAGRHPVSVLLSCAAICEASATLLALGSDHQRGTCDLCARVCRDCAEACDSVNKGDNEIAFCADVCRRCTEACEQLMETHADATR